MKFPPSRSVPALGAMLLACLAPALAGAADGKLTPEDYAEIQNLDGRYAFAIETCTNKGYDYADLYVPDGEFGVASGWGQHPEKILLKGRDALANADGGGPGGCRDPKTSMGYGLTHMIVNTVITATPTGATSKELLLVLGVGHNPTALESQGGYESTYVKTANGWRYVTRYHVFPGMASSIQFGPPRPPKEAAAPPPEPAAPASVYPGPDPKTLIPPGTPGHGSLTAQDYIDIEQLSARYAFAVDHCSNNGYDYADIYTEDGEFGIAPDYETAPKRTIKGRGALADIDGGGPGGCRDPKTLRGYGITHIILAPIISPSPLGATGTALLLALGVGGDPNTIERQGGYKDVYVKTARGWRIKSRWHVFPNMATSIQFGSGGARKEAAK